MQDRICVYELDSTRVLSSFCWPFTILFVQTRLHILANNHKAETNEKTIQMEQHHGQNVDQTRQTYQHHGLNVDQTGQTYQHHGKNVDQTGQTYQHHGLNLEARTFC
uniref:Uncharacterized protein n=1 Tax=Globodera rostochiensis TaxID=31243 RepID=A0A914HZY2_GLORO